MEFCQGGFIPDPHLPPTSTRNRRILADFEDLTQFDGCIGNLAPTDVFFGAKHVHFANDLSTAKLSESKYDAFLQRSAPHCPAGTGFCGLALCWSRSYGRLALRDDCNLMEHPFEDEVMNRI